MKRAEKKETDNPGAWCTRSEIVCNRAERNALAQREQRHRSASTCLLLASLEPSDIADWRVSREGQWSCEALEHTSYREWLQELGLFSLDLKGGCSEVRGSLFSHVTEIGQEVMA